MLKIIYGPAGSGKTSLLMDGIRKKMRPGAGKCVYIVPEQYSHEAERELCQVCGDSLSLYAEVLSFTGLARRAESELGLSGPLLDKGGRLLCMALALDAVGPSLRVYGSARRRPELGVKLIDAVDELKSSCVSAEALSACSAGLGGGLGMKLHDLSLLLPAYDAVASNGRTDPSDRLTRLAERLGESAFCGRAYFIDGFSDFTAQELEVIRALAATAAEITVCLTLDGLRDGSEVFDCSRVTARKLENIAKSAGLDCVYEQVAAPDTDDSPISFICKNLFAYTNASCESNGEIRLHSCDGVAAECELAASRCLELVRDGGCRWRDIAVAARGFEDYRPSLESIFEYYGVPLYLSRKSDIMQKPVAALISSAFDVVSGGWDYESVFGYLKTGLTGLAASECDELENYVLLWNIHGGMWTKPGDWSQHPDGYGAEYTDLAYERLKKLNAIRRRAATPLHAFEKAGRSALTGAAHVVALIDFLSSTGLPETLSAKARALSDSGRRAEAMEYSQLWNIVTGALGQFADVLGHTAMEQDTFFRLFTLMLSRYDVGTIPISLDRVGAGELDRMRRRHIKHLIILGASDERLPSAGADDGIFTLDDRARLCELGIELAGGEAALFRELNLIYNCLSLPSETLTVSYSLTGSDGAAARPSMVVSRISSLTGSRCVPADIYAARSAAPGPALELAALAGRGFDRPVCAAALEYFRNHGESKTLDKLSAAAVLPRGRLSAAAVRALYGDTLRLSASRVDLFSSCRFAYFMQYGLNAKPRRPAGFEAPEYGTFIHYVLESVASDISRGSGFKNAGPGQISELTDKYIKKYIDEKLNGFQEKSPRFIYLFRRLSATVRQVVADMAEELSRSDFEPLDFELSFSASGGLAPVEIGDGGEALQITGVADRVDGWFHEDKLYLRVVDYKTGRKSFSLSDVCHGLNMQMLLYLFALADRGRELYGRQVIPAGVMYFPARDALISADGKLSMEDAQAERRKRLRRSGLFLDDADVLYAMENSDSPRYIPVTFKNGVPSGDSLAGAGQLGRLGEYIHKTTQKLAKQLRGGSITADPYFRGMQENACQWCDFSEACHFNEGSGDRRRYLTSLKPDQAWSVIEGGDENG